MSVRRTKAGRYHGLKLLKAISRQTSQLHRSKVGPSELRHTLEPRRWFQHGDLFHRYQSMKMCELAYLELVRKGTPPTPDVSQKTCYLHVQQYCEV